MSSGVTFGKRTVAPRPDQTIIRRSAAASALERAVRPSSLPPPAPAKPITKATTEPAAALPAVRGLPVLTVALCGGLFLLFCFQTRLVPIHGLDFGIYAQHLISIGGLSGVTLARGEWWRVFTAPLLHAGMAHVLGNCLALALGGTLLERRIGRGWMAAVYFFAGLAGALVSVSCHRPHVVTVGASGAIMGVLACLMVVSLRPGAIRSRRSLYLTARLMIPALIPFGSGSGHVDYSAHLGGALAGLAFGLLILKLWPAEASRPRLPIQAGVAGAVGVVFSLACFLGVAANFHHYDSQARLLIRTDQIPGKDAMADQGAQAVAAYPHDPSLRFFYAASLISQGDAVGALAQMQAARSETELLATYFPPELAATIDLTEALELKELDRDEEAAALSGPACRVLIANNAAKLLTTFRKGGFCK